MAPRLDWARAAAICGDGGKLGGPPQKTLLEDADSMYSKGGEGNLQ